MSFTVFALAWLGSGLAFGALSAYAASRWGRDPFAWLLLGAVLGPIGFLLLAGMHRDDLRRTRPSLAGAGSRAGGPPHVRVLLAVDGSPASARATQYVIDHFGPALQEVTVVGVLPLERANGVVAREESLRRRHLEEEVSRYLGDACAELRAAGTVCRPVTRFGDPADEILRLAQEEDCELIVMGRRGRGAVAKLLLGSVSDKVVRAAACPVMVVS
ncbi:MAG: universal stress protein [Dehalococcoidia bacterium]